MHPNHTFFQFRSSSFDPRLWLHNSRKIWKDIYTTLCFRSAYIFPGVIFTLAFLPFEITRSNKQKEQLSEDRYIPYHYSIRLYILEWISHLILYLFVSNELYCLDSQFQLPDESICFSRYSNKKYTLVTSFAKKTRQQCVANADCNWNTDCNTILRYHKMLYHIARTLRWRNFQWITFALCTIKQRSAVNFKRLPTALCRTGQSRAQKCNKFARPFLSWGVGNTLSQPQVERFAPSRKHRITTKIERSVSDLSKRTAAKYWTLRFACLYPCWDFIQFRARHPYRFQPLPLSIGASESYQRELELACGRGTRVAKRGALLLPQYVT